MDFRLDEDQLALREAARDLLAKESPLSVARLRYSDVASRAEPLWRHVSDAGWTALAVPEDQGGLGFGAVEVALVCEEAGRFLAAVPLWETAGLAVGLLRAASAGVDTCGDALAGKRLTAGRGLGSVAVVDGALTGELPLVPEAHVADTLLVAADGGLWACDPAEAVLTVHRCLDPTRTLADVRLDGTRATRLGDIGWGAQSAAEDFAAVTLAAQTIGAARQLFEATTDYVRVRHQFGVPIGSFQAVQHKLADVLVALEKATASIYRAAMLVDAGDPDAPRAVSIAAVATADASTRAAKEAAQLHGGIGYTWEHDLHLAIRRVYADEPLLGGADKHLSRLTGLLAA